MKVKTIKFIILGAFLFSLTYMNKDKIPFPEELKSFDFVISSGVDIALPEDNTADNFENPRNSQNFSISYISSAESLSEDIKSNANKNLFNVKSSTLNKTIKKIQSLSNKSLNDSHLEYILIGEKTAKENLDRFIDYYAKSPSIRLYANIFITKDMTSEDFIKKILTSKLDADARLHGLVNDKNQLSSMTKKNLKDMMQIFYSKEKTGLIPVLAVEESPVENIGEESKEVQYTFGFDGLGIIKNGKLTDYIPYRLVRTYVILTNNIKTTDIEIVDENNNLSVFSIQNSSCKTSFEFDKLNSLKKIIFDVNIDTNYDETTATKNILTDENINNLNALQSNQIKSEIDELLKISKKTDADFLQIGETLGIQHPYKWHTIKDNWLDIFKDTECKINVTVRTKRYLNTNINSQNS